MIARNERILAQRQAEVLSVVEGVMKADFGVRHFRLKPEDGIRLLRLKQWEQKHKVTIRWMLGILIPFWKQKFARYKVHSVFGTAIPTLVGKVSEQIILEQIKKEFPQDEHLLKWKSHHQQIQWSRIWDGREGENWEDPLVAVERYKDRVLAERQERKLWERKLALRPYRNNPWR